MSGEEDTHHHEGQTDSGCGAHPAFGKGVRPCGAARGRRDPGQWGMDGGQTCSFHHSGLYRTAQK